MLRRGMAGLVLAIITASPASAVEVGRLRGHLEFLASEALEGRLTGTPEDFIVRPEASYTARFLCDYVQKRGAVGMSATGNHSRNLKKIHSEL